MPYIYTVDVYVTRGRGILKKGIGTHRFVDVVFANPVHAGDTLYMRPGRPFDETYDGPIDI